MGMTLVVAALAARRVLWLFKLITVGQAGPGSHRRARQTRLGRGLRGLRSAQAVEVVDPRPGPFLHHVGLLHPADRLHRGLRTAVPGQLPHPDHRALGRTRLPAGLLRDRRVPRHRHFRRHPSDAQPARDRPLVAVLRLPHRRRLAGAVHDLQRRLHLRVRARSRGQQRHAALRQRRLPVPTVRRHPAAAGPPRQRNHRNDGPAAAHRGDAGVPDHRAALQAHAHLHGADQRHLQAAAQRPRPAAATGIRRQADRLRKPARRRAIRSRQGRGLQLERHAGLRHLYRVRALPVAVPGVEHRKAALAQARHHGPARPLDGQGALHPGPEGESPREHAGRRGRRGTVRREARRGPPRSRVRLRPRHGIRPRAGHTGRWSAPRSRAASSTPTCCGPACPAAPASSSARWTSSTSITSSTCAAIR